MFYLNDPIVVGASIFAAVMAEYYAEADTDAGEVERDLLEIIDAHNEPVVPGEPEGARDYAKHLCASFASAIRQRQSGDVPWYGPSESG